MTKSEFLKKYCGVKVKFKSYYKFTFIFESILVDGRVLKISAGGSSDDIYRFRVIPEKLESIEWLNPYAGSVYKNDIEIESFYETDSFYKFN